MKRARFTEEQIIAVLKEHEAGAKTADLARKHGGSEATLYNWKAKYDGMDVSEAKRPKALEEENAKLKKRPAEQVPDAAAHRGLLSKRMVGPYPSGGRRGLANSANAAERSPGTSVCRILHRRQQGRLGELEPK